MRSADGGAKSEKGGRGQMIVQDDVGGFQASAAFQGDQLRISGSGADEIDLIHPRISRAPFSRSSCPNAAPILTGSSPIASLFHERFPSGLMTIARKCRAPSFDVACAPIGTWQPPPSTASTARSAVMHARVGSMIEPERRPACRVRYRMRVSIASAP